MKKILPHTVINHLQARKIMAAALGVLVFCVVASIVLQLQINSLSNQTVVNNSHAFERIYTYRTLINSLTWIARASALVMAITAILYSLQNLTSHKS